MTNTPIERESVERLHVKHPEDGVIRRVDEHYDGQSDVEQDPHGAWLAIQNLCAALDAAEAEVRKWQANHDTWRAMALATEAENKRLRKRIEAADELADRVEKSESGWPHRPGWIPEALAAYRALAQTTGDKNHE